MEGGKALAAPVLHLACGVSQVPYQPVPMAIQVATGACQIAMRRKACIVKETAPLSDALSFRVEAAEWNASDLGARFHVHDAQGLVKAVQHIEPPARVVDCKARRPLSHRNPGRFGAVLSQTPTFGE